MALKFNEDIDELKQKFNLNDKYEMPPYEYKFGVITTYSPPLKNSSLLTSEIKKNAFTVKCIQPSKENCKILKAFLDEFQNFQSSYKRNCGLLKIKAIYKDPNAEKYYIVQKDYYQLSLRKKIEEHSFNEMDVYLVLREINRFYHLLVKDNEDFAKFFLDRKLGIKPIAFENISYYKKTPKEGLKKWKIKIDFLEFLRKDDEFPDQNIENLHISSFKQLVLKLLIGGKIKEPSNEESGSYFQMLKIEAKRLQENRDLGVISRNFLNCLFNPENNLRWDDIFQHPILKMDIFLSKNNNSDEIWKITEIDHEIQCNWFDPNYVSEIKHSGYASNIKGSGFMTNEDEKTEKQVYRPKTTIDNNLVDSEIDKVQNIDVQNMENGESVKKEKEEEKIENEEEAKNVKKKFKISNLDKKESEIIEEEKKEKNEEENEEEKELKIEKKESIFKNFEMDEEFVDFEANEKKDSDNYETI